ncbi:MAG: hypothetical protein ACOCWR_07900 [Oceanidesulfovibrio sp.]
MKVKAIALWTALILAAVGLGACAHYSAMKGPFKDDAINPAFVDRVVEKTGDELDMTQYQAEMFRTLVNNSLATMLEQRSQSEAIRRDLALTLRNEEVSRADLSQLLNRKGSLMRAVLDSALDDFIAWHGVLDETQRNTLAELVLERCKGPHPHMF